MLTPIVAAAQSVLTVFAAASLHAAFPPLGKAFEAQHPGIVVRFNFNGSQVLESQLENGAQADVFASADQRLMDKAATAGIVGAAAGFASNQLVIVASSKSSIARPQDLAGQGVRLVLCVEAAPCGSYARKLLQAMNANPAFGKGFSSNVARNVASEEINVEAVLEKVSLGEADAGIVYRSDAALAPAGVRVIGLPHLQSPGIVYTIAVTRGSASPALAVDFMRLVRSREGSQILGRFGFTALP